MYGRASPTQGAGPLAKAASAETAHKALNVFCRQRPGCGQQDEQSVLHCIMSKYQCSAADGFEVAAEALDCAANAEQTPSSSTTPAQPDQQAAKTAPAARAADDSPPKEQVEPLHSAH